MCDFCLKKIDNKLLGWSEFIDDSELSARITFQEFNNTPSLQVIYHQGYSYKTKCIKIKYCPKCGRNLEEEI